MLVKDFFALLKNQKFQILFVVVLTILLVYCLFFRFSYKVYDTKRYGDCVKVVKIDKLFNKVEVNIVCTKEKKNKQNKVKQSKQSDLFSDIDAEVLGE